MALPVKVVPLSAPLPKSLGAKHGQELAACCASAQPGIPELGQQRGDLACCSPMAIDRGGVFLNSRVRKNANDAFQSLRRQSFYFKHAAEGGMSK